MKKTQSGTRKRIGWYILVYFICLLLAVLTWTLVKYAEHDGSTEKAGGTSETAYTVLCEPEYTVV